MSGGVASGRFVIVPFLRPEGPSDGLPINNLKRPAEDVGVEARVLAERVAINDLDTQVIGGTVRATGYMSDGTHISIAIFIVA